MKKLLSIMLATIILAATVAMSLPFSAFAEAETEVQWHECDLLYGDVNHDNVLNAKDILTLRKKLALYPVDFSFELSNVNGDENIDTKDLLLIRKRFAGYSTSLGIHKQISDDNRVRYIYTMGGIEFTVELDSAEYLYSTGGTVNNPKNNYPAISAKVTAKNVSDETLDIISPSTVNYMDVTSSITYEYDQNLTLAICKGYSELKTPSAVQSPQPSPIDKGYPEIVTDGIYNKYYQGWQNKYNLVLPLAQTKQLAVGESISYSDTYFAYQDWLDATGGAHPTMLKASVYTNKPICFYCPITIYYTGFVKSF